MNDASDLKLCWIAFTVKSLRERKSWTGRLHVQKLLFILHALNLADPPFEFELYKYGPYSFELDELLSTMDDFGMLAKDFPRPGYGPRLACTDMGIELTRLLDRNTQDKISRAADELASFTGASLEIVATCLWAERIEKLGDEQLVQNRVVALKPRFGELAARTGIRRAKQLSQRLQAITKS